MLAKRWREHGDRNAAHRLVTSHLRLVAKIAMGYRGYGLPISEVISEGNVGLMQAVKRFEPEKGFRLATYAMWWIKAAIQEYILRSWSLVKMGTTANQKKLFFNLRKAKSRISALEEGDMRPDQVKLIAKRLGVTEQDVIDMNRRLGGDASLNAPIREDGDSGEWMDWLVDDSAQPGKPPGRIRAIGKPPPGARPSARRAQRSRTAHLRGAPPRRRSDHARRARRRVRRSRERVRQIEVRAFEKVQKAVKSHITAMESPPAAAAVAAARTKPLAFCQCKECPAFGRAFCLGRRRSEMTLGRVALRHCERSEAIRRRRASTGRFVAIAPRNDGTTGEKSFCLTGFAPTRRRSWRSRRRRPAPTAMLDPCRPPCWPADRRSPRP